MDDEIGVTYAMMFSVPHVFYKNSQQRGIQLTSVDVFAAQDDVMVIYALLNCRRKLWLLRDGGRGAVGQHARLFKMKVPR